MGIYRYFMWAFFLIEKAPVTGIYFPIQKSFNMCIVNESNQTSYETGYLWDGSSLEGFHVAKDTNLPSPDSSSVIYNNRRCLYYAVSVPSVSFRVVPDDISIVRGDTYNISSRPTSITGDYGIIGDNGQITKVEGNTIVNETNNTYYNPATGVTAPITGWSYDYTDRSYTVTMESGDTATITYGDENVSIVENKVNGGDTVVNNYTVYYMVAGSGSDTPTPAPTPTLPPAPTPSPSVCPHNWKETSRTEATCTTPGQVLYTCSQCGDTCTEELKATGHTWQVLRTVQTAYDEEGNLTQQGYTIYQCSVCGEQYKDDQGTGPPGGSGGSGEDKETIWDKLGNLVGSFFKGILGMVEAVLSKILDALTALCEMIMEKLRAVVEVVLSVFDEVPKLFGGFLDFLGAVFPFLPSELMLLLTFGVIVIVAIGIIKALRR